MIQIKVRNKFYKPYLESEGTLLCPLPSPPNISADKPWYTNLKPYERLFFHQTLSSVRKNVRFRPTSKIPQDSLDFQLQSRYNNSEEAFPEKVDPLLQKETCSKEHTFRVLRNTRTYSVAAPAKIGHPLRIGGLKEKISPHSVKLINRGHHSQASNNGYSRQPGNGNFFRY